MGGETVYIPRIEALGTGGCPAVLEAPSEGPTRAVTTVAVKTPELPVFPDAGRSPEARNMEGLRAGRLSSSWRRSALQHQRALAARAQKCGRAATRLGCSWGEVC